MVTMVQFELKDIIHPSPTQILHDLYEKNRLRGEVLAVTDDGQQTAGFFVVRVHGLSEPVIVPRQKVQADGKE